MDDGKREVHGVRIKEGLDSRPQVVRETDTHIIINGVVDTKLSPKSARHLARTLYRLARRIEKRAASAMSAGTAETPQAAQGRSPASATAEGRDAQPLPSDPKEQSRD